MSALPGAHRPLSVSSPPALSCCLCLLAAAHHTVTLSSSGNWRPAARPLWAVRVFFRAMLCPFSLTGILSSPLDFLYIDPFDYRATRCISGWHGRLRTRPSVRLGFLPPHVHGCVLGTVLQRARSGRFEPLKVNCVRISNSI